jgi:hypothetical protein
MQSGETMWIGTRVLATADDTSIRVVNFN